MTKRNLTLGSASGKLGSVVYMRRRGQQIARLLVPAPADPRTIPQCGVRACFANYVNIWRLLSPVVGATWRGVSRYGSRANAFYHHNKGLMPAIPLNWSRAGYSLPPAGLVTYGSLPVYLPYEYRVGNQVQSDDTWPGVYIPISDSVIAPPSVAALYYDLVRWGTGIAIGDVLHVVMYAVYINDGDVNYPYRLPSSPPRVVHDFFSLSPSDTRQLSAVMPNFVVSTGLDDSGMRRQLFKPAAQFPDVNDDGDSLNYAMAIFVERPSAPQYARYSRSTFAVNGLLREYLSTHYKGGIDYNLIAQSYQTI